MSSFRSRLGLAVAIPSFIALLALPAGAVTSGPQILDPAGDARNSLGSNVAAADLTAVDFDFGGDGATFAVTFKVAAVQTPLQTLLDGPAAYSASFSVNRTPLVASTFAAGPGGAVLSVNYDEPYTSGSATADARTNTVTFRFPLADARQVIGTDGTQVLTATNLTASAAVSGVAGKLPAVDRAAGSADASFAIR